MDSNHRYPDVNRASLPLDHGTEVDRVDSPGVAPGFPACDAGVFLFYAEELLFAPKYVRAKKLVEENALGHVFLVHQSEEHDGPTGDGDGLAGHGALDGPGPQGRRRAGVLVIPAPGTAAVLGGDEAIVAVGNEEGLGHAHAPGRVAPARGAASRRAW